MRTVFVDTETTGLNRWTRKIWDLAYIVREPGEADREVQAFLQIDDLVHADPIALKIGRFYDRYPNPFLSQVTKAVMTSSQAAEMVARDFRNAIVVGAVPSFDEETLANLLIGQGIQPTWHYHLVDVETLAAGRRQLAPPWDFDGILLEFGLTYDEADRHSAIGDARMARDLYDRVLAPPRGPRGTVS